VRRALLCLVLASALVGWTPPGDVIRVRGVAGDTTVHLRPSEGGGRVRLDVMTRLLGGTVEAWDGDRWTVTFAGSVIALQGGMPFAAYNGLALPLHEPVLVVDGAPYVPLQLFSEIVPRVGVGIVWDRSRWELRRFPPPVATPAPTRAANTPPGLSRRYTIALDAGHGGVDPGNPGVVLNGRRVNEALLTLQMAKQVEHELRARGLDVIMTREDDRLIALDQRGPLANARRADVFISLHTNAANPKWRNGGAVRGVETYFLATARTEDERRVAAMENEVVRFEVETNPSAGNPLGFILNDIAQNEHLRESLDLAQLVQGSLAAKHPGPNRGVKQAGFVVLTKAFMPAILVEVGFGTNLADARWMASPEGQRDIATSISDAVLEYLRHYERRTRASGQ
jgi:N-acetylmuramoyl-L-alanine amidase